MTARQVFWVTVAGLGIGGADAYYQVHQGGPYGIQYFLGMIFALLTPIGSYFIGLVQPRVAATMVAKSDSRESDTPPIVIDREPIDRRPFPKPQPPRNLPPDW